MGTIATGYYINRVVGLTLTLIFLIFSCVQIYCLRQNVKKLTDVKYFIHYSVFFCAATLLFSFIDSYGVFGLMPYFFSVMMVDVTGVKGIYSTILFIIYGHLSAHYRVIKKEIPRFFLIYLAGIFISTWIISVITNILFFVTGKQIYNTLMSVNGLIWLTAIWIIDMYGYYLVRKFIVDLKYTMLASPTSEKNPAPRTCSNQFDYDEFLIRMQRFHCLISVATFGFTGLGIYGVMSSNALRKTLDPTHFSFFNGLIFYPYLYLLLCCFFTWWVWIPIRLEGCSIHLALTVHTHQTPTHPHSTQHSAGNSKDRENHQLSEEMVILTSPSNQNEQTNPQENSTTLYPTLRDVASSISQDEVSVQETVNRENSVSREMENPQDGRVLLSSSMEDIREEGGIPE